MSLATELVNGYLLIEPRIVAPESSSQSLRLLLTPHLGSGEISWDL
jgi:hypothetical protein